MKLIALSVVLGGCAASHPSPVAPSPDSTHARVGCFDIDVARAARLPKPVISYRFSNVCSHEATAELARLDAVAVDPDGQWQPIAGNVKHYDRWSYRIDPHGTEVGERTYASDGLAAGSKICVDLGTADGDAAYAPRWTCVYY